MNYGIGIVLVLAIIMFGSSIRRSMANEQWCKNRDADLNKYIDLRRNLQLIEAAELRNKYKDDLAFRQAASVVDEYLGYK